MNYRLFVLIPLAILFLPFFNMTEGTIIPNYISSKILGPNSQLTYDPSFQALNIKEIMTISPMFTPDNALAIHKWWIDRANSTIEVQNQYITAFDLGDNGSNWDGDSSPIVRALVDAKINRGVNIRVQVNKDSDSDHVTPYLISKGINVRYMGTSLNNPDGKWLSNTHNKIVIIDNKITLLSSINFGENAFLNNREAGMVIQNPTVANYYKLIFDVDWADGDEPSIITSSSNVRTAVKLQTNSKDKISYTSPTNIPRTNFTDTYNVTLFTNPDNADDVIFNYLKSAKTSIYVSMYTISRSDFNSTLIDLKKANPSIDIRVLISKRRLGYYENIDTASAAQSLINNLIPVYNSTSDLNYYHNKYWIIDGKHTFVYSGNWSPRSVTPNATSYSSTDANRDMGIAIHDAPDIASFFKQEVWDKDVAVSSPWELPVGIKQTSFSQTDVISGTVSLTGQVSGIENAITSFRWNNEQYNDVDLINNTFTVQFDTNTLNNGINTFEVRAIGLNMTFTDKVIVNVANYPVTENWKFLITEIFPNPSEVSDEEGEFIELTNSFNFGLLIENWKIGDDKLLFKFPLGFIIEAKTIIIIASSKTGFEATYGTNADFELDFILKNTDGDYAQLLDHKNKFIDVVAYGDITAPDGSESVDLPDAGISIKRKQNEIDTNKATDFIFGFPDPRGSNLIDTENTPFYLTLTGIAIICLSFYKRRKRS